MHRRKTKERVGMPRPTRAAWACSMRRAARVAARSRPSRRRRPCHTRSSSSSIQVSATFRDQRDTPLSAHSITSLSDARREDRRASETDGGRVRFISANVARGTGVSARRFFLSSSLDGSIGPFVFSRFSVATLPYHHPGVMNMGRTHSGLLVTGEERTVIRMRSHIHHDV